MRLFRIIVLTFAMGGLAACASRSTVTGPGGFTPALNGTVSTSGGNYYVYENGTSTILGPTDGYLPTRSLSYWTSGLAQPAGYMYSDGNVRAVAGMTTGNTTFAGISGSPAIGLPTSGFATYNGSFSGTYYRLGGYNRHWNAEGQMSTSVNFSNGTVVGSGSGNFNSSLLINGTIYGDKFNGTAQFSALDFLGAVVPMTGGFYGYNTLAGIYKGSSVAGVFFGQ